MGLGEMCWLFNSHWAETMGFEGCIEVHQLSPPPPLQIQARNMTALQGQYGCVGSDRC